jgi:hypothetical protein
MFEFSSTDSLTGFSFGPGMRMYSSSEVVYAYNHNNINWPAYYELIFLMLIRISDKKSPFRN